MYVITCVNKYEVQGAKEKTVMTYYYSFFMYTSTLKIYNLYNNGTIVHFYLCNLRHNYYIIDPYM